MSFVSINVYVYVCICFVDYEKAFDRVDWRKMMWMLKDIGVDRRIEI